MEVNTFFFILPQCSFNFAAHLGFCSALNQSGANQHELFYNFLIVLSTYTHTKWMKRNGVISG